MFLKSLSMKGFKSFADPTVLEFEPGITVVVGPNGSGKSNVVDAVTWVLGAQGPAFAALAEDGGRHLRRHLQPGRALAGPRSRSPSTTRSGKLPVDMAEVTITRTLFRSGDSEYAINGTPCRLLDIQELLCDSGVGRQQHMIIGQGQLDTVLNARPEDRRANHRGGGRGVEAPPAPGTGGAAAGLHPGEPRTPGRPGPGGASADPPARAPGGSGPFIRHAGRRAAGRPSPPGRH